MILYKLEYLPVARRDILDITKYISQELKNPQAAEQLITSLVNKLDSLTEMPYIYPSFVPIRQLDKEYRKVRVGSYMIFYWVDEYTKVITIARVIYSKRDIENILI